MGVMPEPKLSPLPGLLPPTLLPPTLPLMLPAPRFRPLRPPRFKPPLPPKIRMPHTVNVGESLLLWLILAPPRGLALRKLMLRGLPRLPRTYQV